MLEQRKMKVWSRAGWLVTLVFCIVSSNTAVRAEDNDDSSAARTSNREARQFDFGDSEQKYDLELSFPIDADEATNNDGRIERIDQLIQSILSNEELVSGWIHIFLAHILYRISQHYVHSLSRRFCLS